MAKKELTLEMQEWIEKEAANFEPTLAEAKKKNMKKLPLWMMISVAAMVALGFAVGGSVEDVMKLHLPIGVGIAVFIALTKLLMNSSLSKKTIVKLYTKGAQSDFKKDDGQNQSLLCAQMNSGNYEEFEYKEKQSAYPSKMFIGPDYWVHLNRFPAKYIKASDVSRVCFSGVNTTISYQTSSSNVKQSVQTGFELVAELKADTNDKKQKIKTKTVLFCDKIEDVSPVFDMIRKYCPDVIVDV